MPFPPGRRYLYQRQPLDEVICQLRFPPILRIGTELPAAFQDGVREEYPLYERVKPVLRFPGQQPAQPDLAQLLKQLGMDLPFLAETDTHRFLTDDRKRALSLTTEFLALSDRRYSRWEAFRDQLQRAESLLQDIYRPAAYTRVGLRYRNIISRTQLGLRETRWRDLLSPAILGELADENISDEIETTRRITTLALSATPGKVLIQHGLVSHGGEQCYVIDADFFTEERTDSDDCFRKLAIFNRLAGALFQWAISRRLHEAMGPVELDHPD
jgi:uncharacterized protein (TIGR04255 family)